MSFPKQNSLKNKTKQNKTKNPKAQSAVAVEYTDYFSAEG